MFKAGAWIFLAAGASLLIVSASGIIKGETIDSQRVAAGGLGFLLGSGVCFMLPSRSKLEHYLDEMDIRR
jgi:hypothetical protein